MHRPVLILGLAVLALATVVSRKPWLTPKRLIYRTHVLRLDDALATIAAVPAQQNLRDIAHAFTGTATAGGQLDVV
ncbi:hypothetical protein Pla52n_68450 [Stieleria varia]|uniref:Uncharacterized protein n=1 Tax=Stieleria varia TaxID=2528005 RepID=A0A5C5ZSZ1_9BACT|nr:hypothetical protein Pla52n_68450 [Stieleria varia]